MRNLYSFILLTGILSSVLPAKLIASPSNELPVFLSPAIKLAFSEDCADDILSALKPFTSFPKTLSAPIAVTSFQELLGSMHATWGKSYGDQVHSFINEINRRGRDSVSLRPVIEALNSSHIDLTSPGANRVPLAICLLPQGCTFADGLPHKSGIFTLQQFHNLLPNWRFDHVPGDIEENPESMIFATVNLVIRPISFERNANEVIEWYAAMYEEFAVYAILRNLVQWAAENFRLPESQRDSFFRKYTTLRNNVLVVDDAFFILIMANAKDAYIHAEQTVVDMFPGLATRMGTAYQEHIRLWPENILEWIGALSTQAAKLSKDACNKKFDLNPGNVYEKIREAYGLIREKAKAFERRTANEN